MKIKTLFGTVLPVLLLQAGSACADQQFPVMSLTAGMYVIQAEVAANDAQRQQGLMFREKLAPNSGMVFLFNQPAQVCMWMKNTYVPLSVAFIDERGKILNIEDMQPQTTSSHCATGQATYALEMNKGWFAQKNIKPGTLVSGLPKPR
jgi:uncharacterized membrane protein (UPF0127 family)